MSFPWWLQGDYSTEMEQRELVITIVHKETLIWPLFPVWKEWKTCSSKILHQALGSHPVEHLATCLFLFSRESSIRSPWGRASADWLDVSTGKWLKSNINHLPTKTEIFTIDFSSYRQQRIHYCNGSVAEQAFDKISIYIMHFYWLWKPFWPLLFPLVFSQLEVYKLGNLATSSMTRKNTEATFQ